ncbi:type VII secretion-associated serine protease mycosin [Actinoplanes sp. NPDC051346]|uniref:type VII secretion-associated serine protease mycosin n=1 Tax=Actinoplanes sp. NPDC051346 TaxID=3155048 RepID=UPI00341E2E99
MRNLSARVTAACLAAGLSATPVLASVSSLTPSLASSPASSLAEPIAVDSSGVSTGGAGGLAGPLATPEPLRGDSVRSEQWHLKTLNVADAWTYSAGEGVTVAVIDSGVEASHVDLRGQVLKGLDLVDPSGNGDSDLVGHGTTVSALIAGRADDTAGVVGIAPKAKILPVRVLDRDNRYDDAMIVAKGVRWAVDNGARVINLSLGGNGSSPALAAALDYAFAKDVVVVACTGNASASTSSGVWYPAREPGVIAVAGMERGGDALWSGSITGKETVVTAPATELVGARADGYWRVQGTSFAAPMVSGTAALIRARWPTMPAGEVVNRIIKTAHDRGAQGRDSDFGFGLVDPAAALTAEIPAVIRNPLDTTASPGIARFGSAPVSGQAQSAPDDATTTTPGARASGANAGSAIVTEPDPAEESRGWWAAATLFLASLAAAAWTVRRFAGLA